MNPRKLLVAWFTMILVLSFNLSPVQADVELSLNDDVSPTPPISDPKQISPSGNIYTKTPTFTFTQYENILKYRIRVKKWDNTLYYSYKGIAVCSAGVCSLKPTTVLTNIYGLVPENSYRWAVEAMKSDGTWTGVQAWVSFARLTKGFTSTFDSERNTWQDVLGNWTLTSLGQLKNSGIVGKYTSVAHQHYILDDFTYEAKIRLISEHQYQGTDLDRQSGGLVVEGIPRNLVAGHVWVQGVYVLIRNDQKARIFEYFNGLYVDPLDKGWESVPSIKPGGWNTIKVQVVGNTMSVYINNVLWKIYTDTEHYIFNYGAYVGLTHYRYAVENERMLVDSAIMNVNLTP